jgi:hypothetical protein
MLSKKESLEWLCHRTNGYRSNQNDIGNLVEESGHEGKLGQGFSSLDSLEEIDLSDRSVHMPTCINVNLSGFKRIRYVSW